MKKIILSILIFGILSLQTPAENPREIGSSTIDINVGGELKIIGDNPKAKLITLEINIPVNDSNQRVDVTSNPNYKINSNENESLLRLEWHNPSERVIYYNIDIRVKRDSFNVPITSTQRGHNPGYLKGSKLTRWNAEIKNKAQQLGEGADNDLIIIGAIAQWVHRNVEYDFSLYGADKDAQWVFENKRGTCVEFSNLFISMCKSVGIPA